MRILCIGDQHFQTNNVDEIEVFMKELDRWLSNNQVDLIISLGDLLHQHERLNTLSLNRAIDYLTLIASFAKTYVLVGNHDMINASQFQTKNNWLYFLSKIPINNLTVIDKVTNVTIKSVTLTMCPFVPDGRFIEALNEVDWKNSKCIFAHQTIDGAKMGPIIASGTDVWKKEYPMCISGHIHEPQMVTENFIYVGSIFSSDSSKHRLLLVDTKNSFTDVYLNLLRRVVVKLKVDAIDTFNIEDYTNVKTRLIIECDTETEWKAFKKTSKYKELLETNIKIDPLININKVLLKTEFHNNDKMSFLDILDGVVKTNNNSDLTSLYKYMVYGIEELEIDVD